MTYSDNLGRILTTVENKRNTYASDSAAYYKYEKLCKSIRDLSTIMNEKLDKTSKKTKGIAQQQLNDLNDKFNKMTTKLDTAITKLISGAQLTDEAIEAILTELVKETMQDYTLGEHLIRALGAVFFALVGAVAGFLSGGFVGTVLTANPVGALVVGGAGAVVGGALGAYTGALLANMTFFKGKLNNQVDDVISNLKNCVNDRTTTTTAPSV